VINRVILVGNLTRDADAVPSEGKAMTRMRLATNHQWKDADGNKQEAPEFHSVLRAAGGGLRALLLEGAARLHRGQAPHPRYDGAGGIRRSSTEIVAETVKLLQTRKQADDAAGDPAAVVAETEA
jgi:single-strand DNA-binding protein